MPRAVVVALIAAGATILVLAVGLVWALNARPTSVAASDPAPTTAPPAPHATPTVAHPAPWRPTFAATPTAPPASTPPPVAAPVPAPAAAPAPVAPAAPAPAPIACPTGGVSVQLEPVASAPSTTAGIWIFNARGTLTNGYSRSIVVSDITPPRVLGLDSTAHTVISLETGGQYDRGSAGTGMLTLTPGESVGFSFSDRRLPYDPASVVQWVVGPKPETVMLAQWAEEWATVTKACGNPGGWH